MNNDEYRILQRKRQLMSAGAHAFRWLQQVGKIFKEKGFYDISLIDYYDHPRDIEVAAMVELILPEQSKRREDWTIFMYDLLGRHPYDTVITRDFVSSLGDMDSSRIILRAPNISLDDVFNVLDWCWDIYHQEQSIEKMTLKALGLMETTYDDPMLITTVLGDSRPMIEKLKMILCRLTLKDGIGKGIWDLVDIDDLPCPMPIQFEKTLKVFCPFYRLLEEQGSEWREEIIKMAGFHPVCEFIYAAWGYKEIMKRHGEHLKRWEKNFKRRWKNNIALKHACCNADMRWNLNHELPCLDEWAAM